VGSSSLGSLPQYGVPPPSALTACPRMIMASLLRRKEIVRATSTGSMCRANCELELRKDVARSPSGELAIGDRDLTQHIGRHASTKIMSRRQSELAK
jgi:hypothetical protein